MNDLISIIIPAYNIENHLPATLDSVLAQTHRNIEVIAVNDGSKDSTGAVIDRYAAQDARVKAIHKENGGVTSASGRRNAEGNDPFGGGNLPENPKEPGVPMGDMPWALLLLLVAGYALRVARNAKPIHHPFN